MKIIILNKKEEQYIKNCIMNDYELVRQKNKNSIKNKIFKKFDIKEIKGEIK